jgi:hypothetical protein
MKPMEPPEAVPPQEDVHYVRIDRAFYEQMDATPRILREREQEIDELK